MAGLTTPVCCKASDMTSRASNDHAFVLHSLPYKETSLVVELFCREAGRLPVIAKGAKRPHSALRPVLVSFQPLLVRFSGKSEVKTLTHAEWLGGCVPPEGKSLFAAYYLNELLMRGLQREDPHAPLFDLYATALQALAQGDDMNVTVRGFELSLLQHLGYGLDFENDATGGPIQGDRRYIWVDQAGWQVCTDRSEYGVSGKLIVELGQQGQMTRAMAASFRPVTRQLLVSHVAPNGLLSRVWMEQLLKA